MGRPKKAQKSVELSPPPAMKSRRAVIVTREATDLPVQESHRAAINPAVQNTINTTITSKLGEKKMHERSMLCLLL